MENLNGKMIAILVANGFEQSEMTEPKQALLNAGAQVAIISPEKHKVKGWKDGNWGDEFAIDLALSKADANDYDALLLPGGVMNPDKLRLNELAVNFVNQFVMDDKPIGAICHGPWILIEAGGVQSKKMTSWPSIRLDLTNAGANWVDQEVVIDGNLITSRKPADLPAFNEALIAAFSK